MENNTYLYDIFLNGNLVGDQGDEEFLTKEEAINDATNYINAELCKEYNATPADFYIECYVL